MKNLFLISTALFLSIKSLASPKADHAIWNSLLNDHVSNSGKVDYQALKIDKDKISAYLVELKEYTPGNDWSIEEKKAYYINMYNAYTIQFVVNKYPIDSPNDISYSGKNIWELKLVKLGQKAMTLNQVKTDIIRAFGDPRIHFAICDAHTSDPNLLNKAFYAGTLNQDLDLVSKRFINDLSKNQIKEKKVALSKLFETYALDFKTKDTTVIDFINKYSKIQVSDKAKIEYLPIDLSLNK